MFMFITFSNVSDLWAPGTYNCIKCVCVSVCVCVCVCVRVCVCVKCVVLCAPPLS